MAHSALHFSLGMAVATAATAPPLRRAWRAGERVAGKLRTWLVACYACGLYAIIPSLLGRVGVPERICRSGWMNVFLLHPALTRLKPGGTVIGPAVLLACIVMQYACLLAAVRRSSELHGPTDTPE